jgi:hypothetical protein
MIKTQIQFPGRLYREAKRIAAEHEMSFAEVVRRGVEEVVKLYPPDRTPPGRWQLPAARDLGAPLLPEDQWDVAGRDEA